MRINGPTPGRGALSDVNKQASQNTGTWLQIHNHQLVVRPAGDLLRSRPVEADQMKPEKPELRLLTRDAAPQQTLLV
jgi:hypothetical protein